MFLSKVYESIYLIIVFNKIAPLAINCQGCNFVTMNLNEPSKLQDLPYWIRLPFYPFQGVKVDLKGYYSMLINRLIKFHSVETGRGM